MVSLTNLPVVDLTEDNIESEWNNLVDQVKSSTFISIDVELSGIGSRKDLNNKSIEERYKALSEVAKSYSVLSWGISCFKIINLDENQVRVTNKTYNLFTFCNQAYMVDPESLKFLQKHNFDFNLHVSKGIRYNKGNDNDNDDKSIKNDYSRNLFTEIAKAKVPLILHNGFLDLIFLYENFYANCPNTVMKFVADLSEIFPNGIFDTKYIVDFHVRYSASYLEYLFLKTYYENSQNKIKGTKPYVNIEFIQENELILLNLEEYTLKLDLNDDYVNYENNICKMFCKYGFCSNHDKKSCTKIHNTDLILSIEIIKSRLKCSNSKKKKHW